MPPKRASSASETPLPSTEPNPADASSLPEEEWTAMQDILDAVYDYRTADGYDPSRVFHRKVNKRAIPDYYDVIKEPIAMSTIKAKIHNHEYKHFADFVRDFALIPHNAQVYNRPNAGVYQDALTVRNLVEQELKKLVDAKVIPEDVAKLPYLGEIPAQDDVAPEADDAADDDDDDDDDDGEGEEDEDTDEEGGKRKKRRPGRPSKRDRDNDKADDPETRKKRGRPPKVLTPTEARIQAVLKGMRKPKNQDNQLMISHFERLPDKAAMPEYFVEIKNPMAYDMLKRKLKRKKYPSLDHFMKDADLMFENAKVYNEDDSQIYKDALHLQAEAHRLADEENAKPDSDYVMEEGRIPMPNGILHNGELYRVGDWVHIQNVNDLTKPIPCQIYRTWQDADGGQFVNVCWYYRPEQTVHRFDKHFLENEVVKTGQYRDHRIDEIVDRCFIMFFTRYYKGRPRALPPHMEIYVCQARYNEEKFKFNKIKTWASCLPDEVRDKDYEMTIFDAPKRMKKNPSPIAYLLKDDAKETDDLPKPEWGAENAPPKIGAVHKRPRDPQESPPPEPTPTPPPQQQPQQLQQLQQPQQPAAAPVMRQPSISQMTPHNPGASHSPMPPSSVPNASMTVPTPTPRPQPITRPSHTPVPPQHYPQQSMSPAPSMQRTFSRHAAPFPPATPQQAHPTPPPPPRTASHPSSYPTGQIPPPPPSTNFMAQPPRPSTASYRDPPPVEVYTLPDTANASIPPEIREQFDRDEQGRVLFFTAPPIQVADPYGGKLGHSIKYLAAKSRREEETKRKRELYETAKAEAQLAKKKARVEEAKTLQVKLDEVKAQALQTLEKQLVEATKQELKRVYGDEWRARLDGELERLAETQKQALLRRKVVEEHERLRIHGSGVKLGSAGTLLGDD